MAKDKKELVGKKLKQKVKIKRKGVHAKKKISVLKTSKNYKKLKIGQG